MITIGLWPEGMFLRLLESKAVAGRGPGLPRLGSYAIKKLSIWKKIKKDKTTCKSVTSCKKIF